MENVGTSADQRRQRDRMGAARDAYARIQADPVLLSDYQRRAQAEGLHVWLLVCREYLSSPKRPDATASGSRKTDAATGKPACTAEDAEERCSTMLLAWTTVATRDDANRIARDVIERKLAACVQIDGPITSHYSWQGKLEQAEEFRLCFKLLPQQAAALENHVLASHPFETPEWLLVPVQRVSEKYLSWATANSHSPPL